MRLAAQGEQWAEIECRECEEAVRLERSLTAQIKDGLEQLAMDHPNLPWTAARRQHVPNTERPAARGPMGFACLEPHQQRGAFYRNRVGQHPK